MISVKIICVCGQKYAFDAEPVDGRLSQAVQCPVCGADGTAEANRLIAGRLAGNAPAAPGLRIGGRQRPSAIPLPMRSPAVAVQPIDPIPVNLGSKRTSLVLGVALVSILALAGVIIFAGRHNPRRTSESRSISSAAAAGLPQTLAELNAWYAE